MKKLVYVSLLLIFLSMTFIFTSCNRDDNMVFGTISYTEVGTDIEYYAPNASVKLVNYETGYTELSTTTDDSGYYIFYPVDDGSYYIEAEYSGVLFDYTGETSVYYDLKRQAEEEIDLNLTY